MPTTISEHNDNIVQGVSSVVDRSDFLTAMRAVANSVTVVTTDGIAGRRGGTVSAFSSVSADPPTVLVCLHGDSVITRTVKENGHFCVNILPTSHQLISDRFAGRHDAEVEDRFTGIDLAVAPHIKAPVFLDSTAFFCNIKEQVNSGTHQIFIGNVLSVKVGEPDPLLYFDGAYHEIGSKL